MIKTLDLGSESYRRAWRLQRVLRDNLISEKSASDEDALEWIITVEHKPVYTLGRHAKRENILYQPANVEFVDIERGGDITYHGPGQLVVYFIIDLDRHGLGVKAFVELMERSVMHLLRDYGISSHIDENAPGVWLGSPDDIENPLRKICALGLQCRKAVTMHGLALNVNTDLRAFTAINPCGFTDRGVTSMEKEMGRKIVLHEVAKKISEIFISELEKTKIEC